ncbi:adenosine receptor A2a isoform X2 [Leopardus geoffroyi]|uniref:Adenosine receptor A2 n=1 Tax=Acinonyx jubatus TaxID=32536 RepID=A0A6J1Y4R0_ACIJB|nr:adenosine receptor A2a isoform X2 [Acinonyx jubatus]XP_040299483.1 adenosine receptor A2a isoform X2 [Puma yagouaroundi]XP_045313234.1 adenosine receptor A2a isoform X2 [Leopardus geoffroyi]
MRYGPAGCGLVLPRASAGLSGRLLRSPIPGPTPGLGFPARRGGAGTARVSKPPAGGARERRDRSPSPSPRRRGDSGSRRASCRYNGLVTGTRAKGIIAVCWVLSFAIGLTPMLGWNNCSQPKEGKNHSQGCGEGQVACLFEDVVPMNYMVYYNFFACVLVPLLLMLGVYLRIFLAARRQLKQMESQPLPGERTRSTLQKEVHAAKSLAIIVGLFALCWLPLHIINCFTFFCPECNHAPLWLMYLTIILSHTNSVVNPFIYAYRIREFRQTFRKIIRSHILRRREPFKAGGTSARALAAHGSDGEQISLRLNGHPPGVWANGSAPHPERRPNGYALGLVSGGSAHESHGDMALPDVELLSHELKGACPESPGLEGPLAQDGAGVS